MTTIDRFHSSDNTLSENAAYQLVSGRICQWRRYTFYDEFECSTVSLQYMPILNAHCHCSLWSGLATEWCTQWSKSNSCGLVNLWQAFAAQHSTNLGLKNRLYLQMAISVDSNMPLMEPSQSCTVDFPPQQLPQIYTFILTTLSCWYYAYLVSFTLMCCILSECMLVQI